MDKSAYMLRISQASPTGLVVINFELILEYLKEAEGGAVAEEKEPFRKAVQKAKDGFDTLISALDFEVAISQDFYEIYNYCYKLLCDVHFSQDGEAACSALKEVAELVEILLTGWRDTAEKADTYVESDAAPKVYAGLTYGKDGQAVEYIENNDRGYMA